MARLTLVLTLFLLLPTWSVGAGPQQRADVLPPTGPRVGQPGVLIVRTRQAGLLQVSAAALQTAGWDLTALDPALIHATRQGRELPIQISGGVGGRLRPTDDLRLLVAASDSRWTDEAVIALYHDTTAGLRSVLPTVLPTPYIWEHDTRYDSRFASVRGDRWFAAELQAGDTFTPTLNLPAEAAAGTTLAFGVHSVVKRNGHQLVVRSGATVLGTLGWDDSAATAALTLTLTLPVALPAGAVPLSVLLTSAGDPSDRVLLDRIVLPTISVPAPLLPTPTLEAVTFPDLTRGPSATQTGATVLLISPARFVGELAPLIAAHQRRGDTVAVVDAQAAYATWSYGETDPEALRSLIRTAIATWEPPPRMVLLVGAGSVLLRSGQTDVVGTVQARVLRAAAIAAGTLSTAAAAADDDANRTSVLPPYLLDIDPLRGEIACDTCYTRIGDEVRADPVPAIPIGRLPVRTVAEARVLIAKTVAALAPPVAGAWQRRVAVVADNDRERDGTADPAGSFTATAETGIAALPRGLDVTRFYYAPDRVAADAYDDDVARLRCRLFRLWDGGSAADTRCAPNVPADPGLALLIYVGHGSPWQWAATDATAAVPYVYYLYDADGRHGGTRLPILLSMTCLTGDWANPTLMTTDERLLLRDGGGVAVALASAGQGVNTRHAQLLSGLLPTLFAPTGPSSLGLAHLAGLRRVAAGSGDRNLLFAFNVLGDPDIAVPFVPRGTLYAPLVGRS